MNKVELQEHITGLIIKELESGSVPWHKGWNSHGLMASNLVSRKPYQGINALVLSIVGSAYSSPYWLTYKQAQNLGGSVKLGEKGTHITYYSKVTKKDKDTEEVTGSFSLLKGYVVFNADQCEGISVPTIEKREPVEVIPALDSILSSYKNRPEIFYKEQDRAFYSPSADTITLPSLAQFESAQEHAYTLAHELIHSTGHESRCNRWSKEEEKPSRFGCESYAKEELIAEIGACLLLTMAGVEVDIKNSGAYIKNWLSALKDDKTLIFTAAAKASAGVGIILGEVKEEVMA
jgi:antirestriction protein ArdC